ncbi:DsbC family protein [Roseateles depolymerans]|uniref:Thiol:disulfide interchange protein n=1 Tax=Roseateles depolymerans TaxID=76731 RepID=A0A0U3MVX7_9BURK|nr:DsbC family protein [Roseateles depolymerans]ALV08522.1 Putative thiol:disulfide interchange protein [Roseateles depolymerans]REG21252.1 thiol:disulfide interchange protein DsbC [Roseateles depolymerans]
MKFTLSLLTAALALVGCTAQANEDTIRKNLGAALPKDIKLDEVRQTPIPGLWEVRIGTEIRYTDASGQYLIEGEMLDLKNRRNLTQDRITKITMVDFSTLPLKDAIVWKKGDGKRRIAVFADPNCGYCKRFEQSLQAVNNVTVYTFVIPILGGDSPDKARAAWCAKDSTAAWRDWMVSGVTLPRPDAKCDASVIDRNVELSRKLKVNGTPAIVFEDGTRAPGALSADQLEQRLQTQTTGAAKS